MTAPSTFADAWHSWLRYRACGQRPLRLSTLADYESIYRCHLGPHLGDVPLAEIDGTAIAGLVVTLSATGMRPSGSPTCSFPCARVCAGTTAWARSRATPRPGSTRRPRSPTSGAS
jgi:hypothetical protein